MNPAAVNLVMIGFAVSIFGVAAIGWEKTSSDEVRDFHKRTGTTDTTMAARWIGLGLVVLGPILILVGVLTAFT